MALGRTRLLAVRSTDTAVALFAELGYNAPGRPFDADSVGLSGVSRALYLRSDLRSKRRGYGVVVAEADHKPPSLRPLARVLRERIHDRPLGVLGITGTAGRWTHMIVFRPRLQGRRVTLAKLEVDLAHPTQHDARVLEGLVWAGEASQAAIDRALDVEAVTRTFFSGLRSHYDRLRAAMTSALDSDVALRSQVKDLGDDPAERLALRVLVQILFCQFLQRKGFIEGRPDWLSWAWHQKHGPYYQTVLEPLFYDALGTPRDRRRSGLPSVPYLNGGLFDRPYGHLSVDLDDELFSLDGGLLGYLDGWTFTIAEEMPEEAEVAVDPEMLGKVFEHLAGPEAIKAAGTVYTPRPVVHFMCREALVPWLCQTAELNENQARHLLTDPAPLPGLVDDLGTVAVADMAETLPAHLDGLRILDPAVGSGAFPLGMLAEIVRLRRICHLARHGDEAPAEAVHAWKLAAIEHGLLGVDIEPRAIELCRLRLWLSLVVDLPAGLEPHPLPNLEFRTITADSMVDFVHGIEIQNSRGHGLSFFSEPELIGLHDRWFSADTTEAKAELRARITAIEERAVNTQLDQARASARSPGDRRAVAELAAAFAGPGRAFPCFVPALHAPEVAERGGWDIVIMNPPYVGRKELPARLAAWRIADLRRHYGDTNDLMILFALRAFQLARPGGIVSMIFNDSIFTSTDADDLRRHLTTGAAPLALARTKCFEGMAVNGGVIVARAEPADRGQFRWVEGYRRDVADFVQASDAITTTSNHRPSPAGTLEVWQASLADYRRLPPRPLFRPAPEALRILDRFEACRSWRDWTAWDPKARTGWRLTSNTRAFAAHRAQLRRAGFYDRLGTGDWVLLGLVIEGGQGLATADDKRFLAAIDGTPQADVHQQNQVRLAALTLAHPAAAATYRAYEHHGVETALLAAWAAHGSTLGWPKGATFRIVDPNQVRADALSDQERHDGITESDCFVPFEKGDSSDTLDGRAIGATWWRANPVVIDWSSIAVTLLRQRAQTGGAKSPRLQNEPLWFSAGVTWNRVASYLRPRLVPAGSIFADMAPLVRPTVPWLPVNALCALLFSDVSDFILRTFLGSRMHIEIGDIRRLPVPVLDADAAALLDRLGAEAVAAKSTGGADRPLADIEAEVNAFVRRLYSLDPDADLWVVR